MILILIPAFLTLQIVLFIKAVKTKKNLFWAMLFVAEIVAVVVTECIARYTKKKKKNISFKDTCIPLVIATLSTIAKV